ncbi:MAG: hypothetical protein KGJ93_03310, partial [Patescibacteria group bacterium]|nr:hypothetical protein [Patescibacteria group bacterium]
IMEMTLALQLDKNYPERYGELGFYYYLKGDLNQALALEEKSLAMNSKLTPSLLAEAKIYQQQNRLEPLRQVLERLYLQNPQNWQVKYVWFAAKQAKTAAEVPLNISFPER